MQTGYVTRRISHEPSVLLATLNLRFGDDIGAGTHLSSLLMGEGCGGLHRRALNPASLGGPIGAQAKGDQKGPPGRRPTDRKRPHKIVDTTDRAPRLLLSPYPCEGLVGKQQYNAKKPSTLHLTNTQTILPEAHKACSGDIKCTRDVLRVNSMYGCPTRTNLSRSEITRLLAKATTIPSCRPAATLRQTYRHLPTYSGLLRLPREQRGKACSGTLLDGALSYRPPPQSCLSLKSRPGAPHHHGRRTTRLACMSRHDAHSLLARFLLAPRSSSPPSTGQSVGGPAGIPGFSLVRSPIASPAKRSTGRALPLSPHSRTPGSIFMPQRVLQSPPHNRDGPAAHVSVGGPWKKTAEKPRLSRRGTREDYCQVAAGRLQCKPSHLSCHNG